MNVKDILKLAKDAVGVDKYFEDYRLLKSDLDFFKMYLARNRKSSGFWFKVVPVGLGTVKAFEDIIRAYGLSDSCLEDEYAIYTVLKDIILDVYNNADARRYSDAVIFEFTTWLKKELGLYLSDYVIDFVGCSQGCLNTTSELSKIIDKEWEKNV